MKFQPLSVVGVCWVAACWTIVSWSSGACSAGESAAQNPNEIGFVEEFALAEDRAKALEQLTPGTRDYYYYHALHLQNSGQLDEVDRLLETWIKRYKRTGRVVEIESRQALLRYPEDPEGALAYLRRQLNLRFDHQREVEDKKRQLPTTLDQGLISRETLTRRALAGHRGTLDGFETRALEWTASRGLSPQRRRDLLSRLQRPDLDGLPRLVVDDLNQRGSRGFGAHGIHRALLQSQLEECVRLKPELLNDARFVGVYLTKLRPKPDLNWRQDPGVREAYFDRLWEFVSRLSEGHNSLKANVLYHRLIHDRSQGEYNKGRFLTYLRLPRHAPYVNPRYLKAREHRGHGADLSADFRQASLLPPIGSDEPLVRSFLEHFFLTDDNYREYAQYLRDDYVKRRFAETKILAGIGDMEKWYSMVPPGDLQRLRERVDLDFAYTKKSVFDPDAQVSFDLYVKNVSTLIVKVFEINTLNYYRSRRSEVDTAIDLDGLVANTEETFTYREPPLRRIRRHFEFPSLGRRGTYVIEFIGNGKSSRALVRRGRLTFLERSSEAGHIFTILDESNRPLPNARLLLGGQEYAAGKDGEVVVPYSNEPGRRPIVLVDDGFASLHHFEHKSEAYRLEAGIYVDREALIRRGEATVVVRPSLTLNETPVTLSVLEDVKLMVSSTDHDGISSQTEVKDFKLFEDRESSFTFQVPDRLALVQLRLEARVENVSASERETLTVEKSFALNGIDTTKNIDALHLGFVEGEYVLDLLGKSGEVKAHHAVSITVKHHDFRDPLVVALETDADGRVQLGELRGIEWVAAEGPDGQDRRWRLSSDQSLVPTTIHGVAGETVLVPYMGPATRPQPAEFSLLEVRDGTFVSDHFAALSLGDGFLRLRGLSAGDYDLLLKGSGQRTSIRLTKGKVEHGYVLSPYRRLSIRRQQPLQISNVDVTANKLNVRLQNATRYARVHVVATRYIPDYRIFDSLGAVSLAPVQGSVVFRPETQYVTARDIGDEYRYVLERQHATKFPGNLLARPSLLLSPWDLRSTQTGVQMGVEGESLRREAVPASEAAVASTDALASAARSQTEAYVNLDFLGEPTAVIENLRVGEDGVISVPREKLGSGQHIHIIAIDPENTIYRHVSVSENDASFRDLRLANHLDPEKHFTEQKLISVIEKGVEFTLSDITTSDFEIYDSLARIHSLFTTLTSNSTLVEFSFLLRWPELTDDEKSDLYSRYACHELNFFLFKKDPEFFSTVVLPNLRNKYHKTFLDEWLIGSELEDYLQPWAYSQLNIVERILLAQRIAAEREHAQRHVEDLYDLVIPDAGQLERFFDTGILGRALDVGGGLGVDEVREALGKQRRLKSRLGMMRRRGALQDDAVEMEEENQEAGDHDHGHEHDAPAAAAPQQAEAAGFFQKRLAGREVLRQLYRKLDQTREWAENNYYRLPIERQNAELVTVNAFWRDFARHTEGTPFFSSHFAEASRNFTEMMFALSVLDLPFKAGEHKTEIADASFQLDAASPLVVFHKQIKAAELAGEQSPILVSQNFYRNGARYRHEGGERVDNYISDEFLVHTVYGGHIVVTNPTSSRQKLNVLLQIPRGSLPLSAGRQTRSISIDLKPYRTWTHDYFFYFPAAGDYPHYPVHIAKDEKLVGFAAPMQFRVREQPSQIDRGSWDYVSQHGTESEVLAFLEAHNLGRVQLERIAWRMRDADLHAKVLSHLRQRHVYNDVLWSYGLMHRRPAVIREFLSHSTAFIGRVGRAIQCQLLSLDPVERKTYQHMEYLPLVNARAHRLGRSRTILNDRFHQQYVNYMAVLCYRPKLGDEDLLGVTYYLLLQDRIEEAVAFFSRVRPQRLAAKMQYDLVDAYLGLSTDNLRRARSVCDRYLDYPVERWRQLFTAVNTQLDEIETGRAAEVVDDKSRSQQQTHLAVTEASFEFQVEAKQIELRSQNLSKCTINFYLMDLELLFSRSPFVQQNSDRFSYVRPNLTQQKELDPSNPNHTFLLPDRFHSANVLVEVVAGGVRKTQAYFANALNLQMVENYAHLKVVEEDSGRPLAKVYVKVFARMRDGSVRFYKDGYTDLRGRFDYGSLSTGEINNVDKFALLVLSEERGAVVREASPPQL